MASYSDWCDEDPEPDFHHRLVHQAIKIRSKHHPDALQYQPRHIVSAEVSVSREIIKTKEKLSRKERRKLENEEFRERIGEKILESYRDQWMSELFDGLDECEPTTEKKVEQEEEELRHEINTYGDCSLFNKLPPHPATVLDFDQQPIEDLTSQKDDIDITSVESEMTISQADILLDPEATDALFHTGVSEYDVVIYAPPNSGQDENIVSTDEETVTVRIPDTEHMSAWTYRPSAIITTMPHLLSHARFGISLLPREKQWARRTSATGTKEEVKKAYYDLCHYANVHSHVVLRTNSTLSAALHNWKRRRREALHRVEADD